MKFLVIADIHSECDVLDKMDEVFNDVDAVLFAGDFADAIHHKGGDETLEKLVKKHDEIYAVLGNQDEADFIEKIEDAGINAECILNYTNGIAIVGSGGATEFTHDTPNERKESDIMSDFDILQSIKEDYASVDAFSNLIIISHNPPKDTKCDAVNENLHAGSQKLRNLIEEIKPLAVVTGHIHEGTGIDKIGETVVINPGSLGFSGTYAIMEVQKIDGKMKVSKAELRKC